MPARTLTRRSLALAMAWGGAAAVSGPLVFAVSAAVWGVANREVVWRGDVLALLGFTVGIAAYAALAAIVMGLPQVLPFLVLWAVVARRWVQLESIAGLLAGTAAIAVLSASLMFHLADGDPRPLAPRGGALLPETIGWGVVVWLALLLPRLAIPPLRIGAFSTGR